jgi:hypothetical protein
VKQRKSEFKREEVYYVFKRVTQTKLQQNMQAEVWEGMDE